MATRMNPLAGRYFNSPQFAQSMSNLATAFAPPSAQDAYAAARAQATRANEARVAELFASADGFDQRAIAADLYDPTQSYYRVDQDNATTRRGQDVSARTSLANNQMDNETARRGQNLDLIGDYATGPLGADEAIPGIPADIAAAVGLPALPPTNGLVNGAVPDPMSETEVKATERQRLYNSGLLTDEMLLGSILSDVNTINTVDPDTGRPVVSTVADAINQEPFVNSGAEAKPTLETYRTPTGATGTAIFDTPSGRWVDTQTGEVLPQGTVTGKIQDTAAGLGATRANQTKGNDVAAEMDYGLTQVAAFKELLRNNPGIMGASGRIQGFAQDFGQAAREFTAQFGNDGVIGSLAEAQQIADSVAGSQGYDPAFAQAAAYAISMAYFDAKTSDPGGEVNVRELERLIGVYDGGMMGNNAQVGASLDVLESRILARRNTFVESLRNPSSTPATGTPSALTQRAVNPQTGETVIWNGSAWVPE